MTKSNVVASSGGSIFLEGSNPESCLKRLLDLETTEDAEKIRASLEPGWQKDWAAAFGRSARKVL